MKTTLKAKFLATTAVVSLMIGSGSARALQFEWVPLPNEKAVIGMSGDVLADDFENLERFIQSNHYRRDIIVAFALNSTGGNIAEAMKISYYVKKTELGTVIPSHMTCGSACFIIFLAGEKRMASNTAFIAVHSAHAQGVGENNAAKAVTVDMARFFADQGLPDSLIGKIVRTPPDEAYRLTEADLISMGVEIMYDDGGTPNVFKGPPEPIPTMPVPSPSIATNLPVSAMFMKGLADRNDWEEWVSSLSSDYRTGAEYWAGQRSLPNPGSCYGPRAFEAGCEEAKARLTPTDVLRKAIPEYRRGWNSWSANS